MARLVSIPWESLEQGERPESPAAWWRTRAIAEREAQLNLTQLGADLTLVPGGEAWLARVAEAAEEESVHSQLCGRVAALLGAPVRDWPTSIAVDRRLPPRERIAVTMTSALCVSETVSTAMLAVWRDEAGHPTLRAVETQICADESGHARLGFAWLRSEWVGLPMSTKLLVESSLPRAFAQMEATRSGRWRELYREVVAERVIPELERNGVRAARAWDRRAA